jgi:type IV pilus assembly protein PilA
MMGMILVAIVGILAAIAIPRFTDHVAKEKIFELLDASRPITEKLDAYLLKHGALPDDPAAAGLSGLPRHASAMRITRSPEQLAFTLNYYPLEGKELILVLDKNPPDSRWRCTSKDIPDRQLPSHCRRNPSN